MCYVEIQGAKTSPDVVHIRSISGFPNVFREFDLVVGQAAAAGQAMAPYFRSKTFFLDISGAAKTKQKMVPENPTAIGSCEFQTQSQWGFGHPFCEFCRPCYIQIHFLRLQRGVPQHG